MTKRVAAQLSLCILGGWLLGVVLLFLVIELSDGKAFDSTWLSS
jgi:hypothetical protein